MIGKQAGFHQILAGSEDKMEMVNDYRHTEMCPAGRPHTLAHGPEAGNDCYECYQRIVEVEGMIDAGYRVVEEALLANIGTHRGRVVAQGRYDMTRECYDCGTRWRVPHAGKDWRHFNMRGVPICAPQARAFYDYGNADEIPRLLGDDE